ncbi:MAG: protein translocase subunit SecF [Treponema sp.]|nr:protein translocase subunit SecF [Treponema sp.]
MNRNFKFSKAFLGCAITSAVIILCGIVSLFVRGINFGIDFQPGLIEEVRIADAAMEITYKGSATVSVDATSTSLDVVISGVGAENETRTFTYGQNPTINSLAASLNKVDGITATVKKFGDADTYGIFTNNAVTARLSSDVPFRLYVSSGTTAVSIDELRDLLKDQNVEIKQLGTEGNRSFQIRAKISDDSASSQTLQNSILNTLQSKFGANNVAIIKTDFVGSSFSSSLAGKSVLLTILTLFLIWGYAAIRFKWDFALGAVIALIHDCLIMFTFISFIQVEFSTTTLAAILTIFGYSINATVVILDRVRENLKVESSKDFNTVLDKSLNDTLSRSIITTVTTLFASISLLVFTTGSIRDFAIVLTIGLISGCYSSLFISSGFISFMRRKSQNGAKKSKSAAASSNVVTMSSN